MLRRQALLLLMLFAAGATAGEPDQRERCARIRERIAEIRARKRIGYTARQGRRYRLQLETLEAKRRRECR